jgi:hypothetical protein
MDLRGKFFWAGIYAMIVGGFFAIMLASLVAILYINTRVPEIFGLMFNLALVLTTFGLCMMILSFAFNGENPLQQAM